MEVHSCQRLSLVPLTFRFQQFLQIVPTMKHELRKMAEERMTSRLATMPMFKDLDSSQVCAVI